MSRIVLITGGAGGIGRATRERFAAAGDTVVTADRSAETLAELGTASDTVVADVTVVADCERMIAQTVERHGRLDVLVNCAGVWVEGPTTEMTEEQWNRTIDVNLKGTFFACRFAIPHLERTEGCIVNLSSDAGWSAGPRPRSTTPRRAACHSSQGRSASSWRRRASA
jgi:NAD(P)-dependent dehydrogenase (short-subunit alcohol dehydrogenase family)